MKLLSIVALVILCVSGARAEVGDRAWTIIFNRVRGEVAQLYPDSQVPTSPFCKALVQELEAAQRNEPSLFNDPTYPLQLAFRASRRAAQAAAPRALTEKEQRAFQANEDSRRRMLNIVTEANDPASPLVREYNRVLAVHSAKDDAILSDPLVYERLMLEAVENEHARLSAVVPLPGYEQTYRATLQRLNGYQRALDASITKQKDSANLEAIAEALKKLTK